jgi:hypothetical protein
MFFISIKRKRQELILRNPDFEKKPDLNSIMDLKV